jgi:response regulator RpfG family c-di-GMP phosphodiesterase
VNETGDDRDAIHPGDRTLLIVENDLAFAKLLADVAHDAGFKTLVTAFGAAALSLARQYRPSAITLDISLPDIDGWRVLERLKSDFDTRHIPSRSSPPARTSGDAGRLALSGARRPSDPGSTGLKDRGLRQP